MHIVNTGCQKVPFEYFNVKAIGFVIREIHDTSQFLCEQECLLEVKCGFFTFDNTSLCQLLTHGTMLSMNRASTSKTFSTYQCNKGLFLGFNGQGWEVGDSIYRLLSIREKFPSFKKIRINIKVKNLS